MTPSEKEIERFRTLTQLPGIAAHEMRVRDYMKTQLSAYSDELVFDGLGSVFAVKRSKKAGAPKVMMSGHMDEVGFVVSYIDDQGFLRLAPLGGWDARIIPSHLVTVVADDGRRVPGVVGSTPPHILDPEDSKKPHRLEDLFVDVGARSRRRARRDR